MDLLTFGEEIPDRNIVSFLLEILVGIYTIHFFQLPKRNR